MEKIDITIIHKYFSGKASAEETEKLEYWRNESKENRTYLEQLKWIWENSEKVKDRQLEEYKPDTEAALKNLHKKIEKIEKDKTKSIRRRLSWVGIAASFLLILSIWQGDILLNTNDQLFYATQAGETKELLLPDSSKVWLAEKSELSFVNDGKNRKTTFKGKGYFEIAKNKERPFIIQGDETGITVLGTKFNFESNINDPEVVVHVTEGKVKFYDLENIDQPIRLTKGEFGTFVKESYSLNENKSTSSNVSAWATGHLQFEDTKMSEAIKDIEKFYNVSIQVENDQLLNCSLTTSFKNEKLNIVYQTIGLIYQAEIIKTDESNYLIKKGSCI